MANLKVFSVRDQAAGAYLRPFFVETRGLALRGFMDAVQDKQHQFNKHAADYVLFELGSFDEETAKFSSLPAPLKVAAAHELLSSDPDVLKDSNH